MMKNDGVSIGLDFDYSKKFTKRYPSYMRKGLNESNDTKIEQSPVIAEKNNYQDENDYEMNTKVHFNDEPIANA